MSYIAPAPTYPFLAFLHKLPVFSYGIIFAGYSLSLLMYAPIIKRLEILNKPKKLVVSGCILIVVCNLCFGFFIFIQNPTLVIVLRFLSRVFEALGYGLINGGASKIYSTY